jgi:flagellum-specific ATP synthase
MSSVFERAQEAVTRASRCELRGCVTEVRGLLVEGTGPQVPLGSHVTIRNGTQSVPAQVIGFRQDKVLFMPFGEMQGIAPGFAITASESSCHVRVSHQLKGRVIDALGNPLDGRALPVMEHSVPLYRDPPNPVTRQRIEAPLDIGVKAINGLLTIGQGQRVGIMAGSGVGKSTLLGMIAQKATSDVNVIALVGERGREVREFIERDLGPEGLARSVLVVATGDQSALLRIRAAFLATAIAEFFRDEGLSVTLMLDSVTRLAMAQREVGLAAGEPPSTRGYTPSVFAMLPKLLERAGTCAGKGSITGLYTVLVEGDDMNEPVADAVRGILDGHIVLSRKLAGRGHYPAIDPLQSISRVMSDIVHPEVTRMANEVREILASYQDAEDLITIGAYKPGQNVRVDRAVQKIEKVQEFLRQRTDEREPIEKCWLSMGQILQG